jgi:lipopolysaccharide exporter
VDVPFFVRFIKGIISTGIGTFFTLLLGFVNIFISVRLISKEQFGCFMLLQTVLYSFMVVSDLGLNIASTRQIACSEEGEKSKLVTSIFYLRTVISILFSLILLASGNFLFHLLHADILSKYLVLIILLFCFEVYNTLFISILQGLHFYKKLAISQIILSCLNLALMVCFLHTFNNGLLSLILARLISLPAVLLYQMVAVTVRLKRVFDKRTIKDLIVFGFPLGLNNMLSFVFMRLDTLMIGAYLSPIGVAYYGAASKLPDASRQMFESFRSVYFPNMSELLIHKRHEDAQAILNNSLRLITFLSGMATLVVYLFQNEIVVLLFSPGYLRAAPVLPPLMMALSLGLVGHILGTSLVAAGYSKLPVLINIADAAANITANLVLIPAVGIMGAAYAALIARAVTVPLNAFFLKKSGIYPNPLEYLKPLLILGLCIAIGHYTSGTLLKLSLVALYLAICFGFSIVTSDDLAKVSRGVRVNAPPSV